MEADSSSQDAHQLYLRGIEAAKDENPIDAVNLWKECVRIDPHHTDALANLGWYELSHDRPHSAIPYYRKALSSDSTLRVPVLAGYLTLGEGLLDLKEDALALRSFERILALEPDYDLG